ncbi:MAG: quinone-dependent dihydroorotate dehydrogenase [Verrucomicrobia bacterium]|nr:quinone-dependent dihydroorotate dehydrogenase [Cytophagales bacterium]
MYHALLQPLLFKLEAEKAHEFTFHNLKRLFKLPGVPRLFRSLYDFEDKRLEKKVFGLTFKNPIGLAAGFDKNAMLIDELACLGFGFIEVGTLTPRPQEGNPKPRMYRLKADQALINRMGFNNEGVVAAAKRLEKRKTNLIIGGNIGKNKDTPNEKAVEDYLFCFEHLFDTVDYFVVNISSPNTPNLRALQEKEPLTRLLETLQHKNQGKSKPKPILLKIAPDLSPQQMDDILEVVASSQLSGIVATNTTISRENLQAPSLLTQESGGLSGKPLKNHSTQIINYLHKKTAGNLPIIGVGGIASAADAHEKLNAGADLLQIYTGFIYEGPSICKAINQQLV